MTKPILKARIEQLRSLMGYEFVERPGDNDTGVLTSENSLTTAIVHQCVVSVGH